jgi:hypothetical protein
MDAEERRKAYVELAEANKAYAKFRQRLDDFVAFFAPDNIARIGAWASHASHPQPFEAALLSERGISVVSMRQGAHQFRAVLNDLWIAIPDWPEP